MPKFSYTVINKTNQELTGSINAENEQAARQELNALGFSIIAIRSVQEASTEVETAAENIVKFEFKATDKNGKKIVGTIQGEDIYLVFKRLVSEYHFEVEALFQADLSEKDKEKSLLKGIDYLKDKLLEEEIAEQEKLQKAEVDQQAFLEKQARLKDQVDFVLQKVNSLIEVYKEELDPATKAKIKYYVEKILRIKNSTNLDYIKQTCEEMLTYLQKEEIFLNQEQRLKEKTQLSIEAKTMMRQLSKVNSISDKDLFDSLRNWRKEHITENQTPDTTEKIINILIAPFIGLQDEDQEIKTARAKIKNTEGQLKEFLILYFQAPDPEFKKETKAALGRLWQQRKIEKHDLTVLIEQKNQARLANTEFTTAEQLEKEIFGVAGWVLAFYIIYYFASIYLSTKQINLEIPAQLTQLFQTTIIKYFYIVLFLMVCILGIKIEFFKRKPAVNLPLFLIFIVSSTLIVLNF